MRTRVVRCPGCGRCNFVRFDVLYTRTAPTIDGSPGTLRELTPHGHCWNCHQDLDLTRLEDLTRGEIKAMSPQEYRKAVLSGSGDYGEGLDVLAGIIWVGGWVPAGIMAIVVGIVVALISGEWSQFLLIALGGTVLGYLAVMGAIPASDYLDIRWLRTGNPDEAWFVVLLSVGPVIALLVAVLVLIYA